MRIDEIVGKEKNKLTSKEIKYLYSQNGMPLEMTRLANDKEIIEVSLYLDGSYVKEVMNEENNYDGDQEKCSKEELEEMINSNLYDNIEFTDYMGEEFTTVKVK